MIEIQQTLLKTLTEGPAAIVVDLHACDGDPSLLLPVLPTLQRHAREAGVRLLCTADEALDGRIRRSAARWFVEFYPTCEQAEQAALNPDTRRWHRIELEPHPLASSEARLQVGDLCLAWRLGHIMHRARLIVSELVDNAVEHAGTRTDVTAALLGDLLHIRVRDRSHRRPVRLPRGDTADVPLAPRGDGLRLVGTKATSWGVTPTDDGKIVWATVRVRPIAPKAAA